MIRAQKLAIALFIMVAIGFFYKATIKDYSISYASFFTDGDIVKTLKSKLLASEENDEALPTPTDTETTKVLLTTKSPAADKELLEKKSAVTTPAPKIPSERLSSAEALNAGNGIIFLETTDKMPTSSLVLCAIESAARHYPEKPVFFFMKAFTDANAEQLKKEYLSVFSSIKNVHFLPLNMEAILADTPLLSWYKKVDPTKEIYWAHVSSDACRLALLWKHGGIYLDTDFISLKPIPNHSFLAAESKQYSSNAVLGFSAHHEFTWKCMEDFVRNYHGEIWGYQGPLLFTRIRNTLCDMGPFNPKEDFMCGNITILSPKHFYPIGPEAFQRFYEVWDKEPTFEECFALHLWNYANRGAHKTMVPGSNTLVEHLYQKNCPSVYADIAAKTKPK